MHQVVRGQLSSKSCVACSTRLECHVVECRNNYTLAWSAVWCKGFITDKVMLKWSWACLSSKCRAVGNNSWQLPLVGLAKPRRLQCLLVPSPSSQHNNDISALAEEQVTCCCNKSKHALVHATLNRHWIQMWNHSVTRWAIQSKISSFPGKQERSCLK